MSINWGALGVVAIVSLAVGVLVVVLVSLAMVGLSAREPAQRRRTVASGGRHARHRAAAAARCRPPRATAVAVVCLLAPPRSCSVPGCT